MKKRIIYLFSVLAFAAILFTACSEDETKSVSEMLMGKWTPEYMKFYDAGVVVDTIMFTSGEYMDFRSDNKVYSYIDGDYDTSTYMLVNDTKIVTDGTDTMTIKSISETSLLLGQSFLGTMSAELKCKK
jgi:hypothetical protein